MDAITFEPSKRTCLLAQWQEGRSKIYGKAGYVYRQVAAEIRLRAHGLAGWKGCRQQDAKQPIHATLAAIKKVLEDGVMHLKQLEWDLRHTEQK